MPENNGNPFTLTPTHLAACLTTLMCRSPGNTA
jgi:hypothetical protein